MECRKRRDFTNPLVDWIKRDVALFIIGSSEVYSHRKKDGRRRALQASIYLTGYLAPQLTPGDKLGVRQLLQQREE